MFNLTVAKAITALLLLVVGSPLSAHDEFVDVISASKPSVVTIEAVRKKKLFETSNRQKRKKALGSYADFFDEVSEDKNAKVPRKRHGSGFVISGRGEILTAAHVVRGASKVWVRFASGDKKLAQLIRYDSKLDVALLVVEQAPPANNALKLSGDVIREGQSVVAIGAAFGLPLSSSLGIISSIGVSPSSRSRGHFIQTDASINPGSSGGPLLNSKGEVVGLVAKIYSKTGTFSGSAFALPSQKLIEFLSRD